MRWATLRHALNSLAVVVPDWLLALSPAEWRERYGPRIQDYRLPEGKEERTAYATLIGADGLRVLRAVDVPEAPPWWRTIPALQTLRRVWIQNYTWTASATLRWRTSEEIPPPGNSLAPPMT
jgi:transposase